VRLLSGSVTTQVTLWTFDAKLSSVTFITGGHYGETLQSHI
jgi:hypothetical protein